MREIGGLEAPAAVAQHDLSPIVILYDAGMHVIAVEIGRGIHVGNEAYRGLALKTGRGGNGAVNVAFFVHAGVGNADRLHLLNQQFCKIELAGGGRHRFALFIRGGMDLNVV